MVETIIIDNKTNFKYLNHYYQTVLKETHDE